MCGVAAVFGLLGSAVSAMGSIAAANAQAAGMKSEAEWKEREAALNQMETSYEVANRRRENKVMIGSQTAEYAGAGIATNTGSPLNVGLATTQESEMGVQKARIQGKEFQLKSLWDAKNLRRQAAAAKQAGMFGAVSSIIGGLGSAFGSFGGGGGGGTSLVSGAFKSTPPAYASPVAKYPVNVSGGGYVNSPSLVFGGPR